MGIKVHWLNCTRNCTQECREDTLYEWLSADEILYGATSGGIPGSRKHPRPELLLEERWHQILCRSSGFIPTTALAALLCICGDLKLDWIEGVIYNQSLGWGVDLCSGDASRSWRSSCGRFEWQRIWWWEIQLPVIRRSIRLFPCWLDT